MSRGGQMSAFKPSSRRLRWPFSWSADLAWPLAVAFLLGFCVRDVLAQGTPPGQSGFTACVGEVTSNPGGYLELRCSLAAESGVAFEVWRYEGFSCGDVPEWTRAGVWEEGHPVELFVLRSCYDFATDSWVDPPDTRGRAAYRRLYVDPPDGPASSASSPLATSADIARVQSLLEHGLVASLVVAGLWAFRFGVAAA